MNSVKQIPFLSWLAQKTCNRFQSNAHYKTLNKVQSERLRNSASIRQMVELTLYKNKKMYPTRSYVVDLNFYQQQKMSNPYIKYRCSFTT